MKKTRRTLTVLLALLMLSGCMTGKTAREGHTSGGTGTADGTTTAAASDSVTGTSEPEPSLPDTTVPDTTEPQMTVPPTTEPATTVPVTTEPVTTDPPHVHSYAEGKTVEATCTAKGYTVFTCTSCGAGYRKYTPAAGHKFGDWVTVEATCRKTGSKTRKCTVCGKTEKRTLKKVKCHYADATCDKPRICIWCKESDEGLPLFHKWDEGQWLIIDPDTGEGTKKYTCSVCGGTREIVFDKNLPAELTDNPVIRAMRRIGYDIDGQLAAGDLYSVYGAFEHSEKYRSKVTYDEDGATGLEGIETIASPGSATGKLPDFERFNRRGLICASFTAYYYLNYLPNVEGVDMSWMQSAFNGYIKNGYHYRAVLTWDLAFRTLESRGKVTKIGTSAKDVDRSLLAPGDLVLFSSTDYRFAHVAIYAGTVRGEDFVVHCTYKRGVEFNTLSAIADPYKDPEIPGSKVYAIYHLNGNT